MKNRLAAAIVFIGTALHCLSAQPASADALPVNLAVDLTGIALIEQAPDPAAIETALRQLLSEHVAETLYRHWYVTGNVTNAQFVLTLRQRRPRDRLSLILDIRGDTDGRVTFLGFAPQTVPVDRAFSDDLQAALDEFLLEKAMEIEAASETVHLETDDVLKTVLELDRPLADEDRQRFRSGKLDIRWDRIAHYLTYKNPNGDRFEVPIALFPGDVRHGILRPHVYQSWASEGPLPSAEICVRRPSNPDPSGGTVPKVQMHCPLEGRCELREALPADWANDQCAEQQGNNGPGGLPWSWGAARAAETSPAQWSVPTLDVLFERLETPRSRFLGFTEFTIRARELNGLDADAYSLALYANGVPVLVNGIPSGQATRPFQVDRGLFMRFGLENLQFAGRQDGCEKLDVVLEFFKDGEPTGDRVQLTRGYAALRHAPTREIETPFGPFSWSGTYVAPGGRNEQGIFLASTVYSPSDADSERRALSQLNGLRKRLDGFGWTISARELGIGLGLESVSDEDSQLRIVGKLRPPLTVRENGDAAYGLLVGVQEPSGQMQFTFDWPQTTAMRRFLMARRAESPEARAVVPSELFVYGYGEDRREGPEWVCRN